MNSISDLSRNALQSAKHLPLGHWLLIAAGFVALQILTLIAMGQPPICTCGTIKLWTGIVSGPETSQQVADWYTPTHVLHGIWLYVLLWYIAPSMPLGARLAIAIGLEAGWEIVENTPFIINRYRQSALTQGYFGDSVINSVFDTFAAAFGFALARLLPVPVTVAVAITIELLVGVAIHDNLLLNIIQLVHPNGAISRWQAGG